MASEPVVTRSAMRWYGGKWRLAPWIISHFPEHAAYCEPYGGAASVLLRKPPAKLETWNDLESRLVNFFRVLRADTAGLIRAIELTPYAREEYEQGYQSHPDPLEDARRFFVVAQQGRANAASRRHRSGWRYETQDNRSGKVATEFSPAHLWAVAARLREVQIEHDDALAVLRRYDTPATLHYVDPPYVQATRSGWDRYTHELDDDGHRQLAAVLHDLDGMVALSGYPSALYGELYADWRRVDCQALTDGARVLTESLWLNPAAAVTLDRARHRQLSFEESA